MDTKPIQILFGTETGNAEDLAERAQERYQEEGFETEVENVVNFPAEKLAEIKDDKHVVIVISTWGEGDPPDEATEFFEALTEGDMPNLEGLQYSVLALGDTGYDDFCGCGRKIDEAIAKYGGKAFVDRKECDVDFEEPFEAWLEETVSALKS
jgi:sulfite reductase (NADPH) flavoprotein alpha-component